MDSVFIHSFSKLNREVPFENQKRNEAFSILLEQGIQNNFEDYLSRYDFYNKRG